jgi:hypothetical protein
VPSPLQVRFSSMWVGAASHQCRPHFPSWEGYLICFYCSWTMIGIEYYSLSHSRRQFANTPAIFTVKHNAVGGNDIFCSYSGPAKWLLDTITPYKKRHDDWKLTVRLILNECENVRKNVLHMSTSSDRPYLCEKNERMRHRIASFFQCDIVPTHLIRLVKIVVF